MSEVPPRKPRSRGNRTGSGNPPQVDNVRLLHEPLDRISARPVGIRSGRAWKAIGSNLDATKLAVHFGRLVSSVLNILT
jgi:hypothetical protein